jgi:MFS family permease
VVVKLPAPDRLDHTSDTWDYLQIAREIYRSHHYESLFTYVPFLPDWQGSGDQDVPRPFDRFPVLWRQPGFPMLVAGAFAIRGSPDPDVLMWIQGTAIVALPLATYFLASAFLSPGWAFLAGLWALLAPVGLSPNSPFVATTWFTVLVAGLAGLLVRSNRSWIALLSGLVLAGAIFFRLETWMFLPGLLLMFWLTAPSHRKQGTALLLLTAAILLMPWFRTRTQCVGEGFSLTSLLYHDTDTFPGWTSSRTLAVRELTPFGFVMAHTADVVKKTGLDLLRYGRDLVLFPSPFLAPFVWIALLRPPENVRARGFICGTVLAAGVLVLVLCPLEYSSRFLGALVPLFTVLAAISMSRFVRYRRPLVIAATAVGVVITVAALAGRPHRGTVRLAAEDLNELMARPESGPLHDQDAPAWIAFCDAPTLYAWIWNERAVWVPLPEDIRPLRERLDGVGFGSVALVTRAMTHGDGVAPNTIEGYVKTGATASASKPPLLMTWPEAPSR